MALRTDLVGVGIPPAAANLLADAIQGTDDGLTAAELDVLDAVTAGTITASKAAVVGASKDVNEWNVFGSLISGSNATDRVTIKGIYMTPANVSVTVPSITDPDIARVQVDVSAALSFQPTLGDVVIAMPITALMTNCRLQGAYVYQTDGVEICFGSEGGNVTGAAHNFKFLFLDLT